MTQAGGPADNKPNPSNYWNITQKILSSAALSYILTQNKLISLVIWIGFE